MNYTAEREATLPRCVIVDVHAALSRGEQFTDRLMADFACSAASPPNLFHTLFPMTEELPDPPEAPWARGASACAASHGLRRDEVSGDLRRRASFSTPTSGLQGRMRENSGETLSAAPHLQRICPHFSTTLSPLAAPPNGVRR